jgi:hypothetical protein
MLDRREGQARGTSVTDDDIAQFPWERVLVPPRIFIQYLHHAFADDLLHPLDCLNSIPPTGSTQAEPWDSIAALSNLQEAFSSLDTLEEVVRNKRISSRRPIGAEEIGILAVFAGEEWLDGLDELSTDQILQRFSLMYIKMIREYVAEVYLKLEQTVIGEPGEPGGRS